MEAPEIVNKSHATVVNAANFAEENSCSLEFKHKHKNIDFRNECQTHSNKFNKSTDGKNYCNTDSNTEQPAFFETTL